MTVQKTEIELQKALMVKVLRSQIRLKHTLEAERELNQVLPEAERQFDVAVQRGELPAVEEIVRDVVE